MRSGANVGPLTDPDISREICLITPPNHASSVAKITLRTMLRRFLRDMVPEIIRDAPRQTFRSARVGSTSVFHSLHRAIRSALT